MGKDNQILKKIRENSRKRISIIARETKMPVTTAYMKLKKLEKEIVKRYVSITDFEKLGFVRMLFIIQEGDADKIRFDEDKINNLYRTSEGITFDIVFNNKTEAKKFCNSLSEKRIKYSYHQVLETLKIEETQI